MGDVLEHEGIGRCPFFVIHLIPTGAIDAPLRALASGDHREVIWCDEVEWRWAVAADDHVVVELKNMTCTVDRLHMLANKHLLPERVTEMQRVGTPEYLRRESRK